DGVKKALELPYYPMFVHFKDSNDPKSVENVLELASDHNWPPKYTIKSDRTAEIFGKGVKIEDVTIEITKSPRSSRIEGFLPWLENYYNQRLDGQRFEIFSAKLPFANSLSAGAFKAK